MKTILKFSFLVSIFTGISLFQASAQDSIEEKIDKLVEKIDKKLQEVEDELENKFSDMTSDDDEEINEKSADLHERMSTLQERLSEIQNEDSSRQKERDLNRLNDDISSLKKDIERNVAREKTTTRTRTKTYNKYNSGKTEINRFSQTTTIEKDEKISGDVMVTNGDLIVYGEILGDAVAVSGDVIIKNGAKINGDAVSTGGKVIKESGATIVGKTLETKGDVESMDVSDSRRSRRPIYSARSFDSGENYNWSTRWSSTDFIDRSGVQLRYNRVEGLYIGGGRLKEFYWDGDKNFSLFGNLGYAFSSKDLQFQLGYDRWFGSEYRFEFGVEGHNRIQTYDDWMLSRKENSTVAILLHEDFYDFFKEKGGSFHIATYLTPKFKAQLEIKADKQENKGVHADWALFGGKKKFYENPVIQEGDIKAFVFTTAYDHVSDYNDNPSGFYAAASAEIAGGPLKGDYTYNLYSGEFRGYAHFSDYDDVRIRLKVASGENNVPIQKSFHLYGSGGLNGYQVRRDTLGVRSDVGNRLFLANVEYILTGRELRDELPSMFDNFCLVFFDDIGYLGNSVSNTKPWEGFTLNESTLKNSVGFGFTDEDGTKRLTFAWRTDKSNEPVQVMFRWTRPF